MKKKVKIKTGIRTKLYSIVLKKYIPVLIRGTN